MPSRLVLLLAAGAALSGCVAYGPPYSGYDAGPAGTAYYASPYYYPYSYYYPYAYRPYAYGYPTWVGPPISLNFGYYEHHYSGGHGWHGGHPYYGGHGWGGGHGWHGGGYHGGWGGHH